MEGTLKELLDILKEISPEVWDILIRQAYVEVFTKLCLGTFLATCVYVSFAKVKPKLETDDQWIALLVSFVFGLLSFACFLDALKWVLNPEFYALRFLLQQI